MNEMVEPTFTPGPWDRDGKEIIGRKGRRIVTDYGAYEGMVWGGGENRISDEECNANIALICAAPDLYAALEQILDDMGDDGQSCCLAAKDQAIAAIKRALGSKRE